MAARRRCRARLGFDTFGHYYQPEDAAELERLLRPGSYHAVVANPPYIIPNDRRLNEKYRDRFSTCYRQYSLAVPFMQRIFDLAGDGGYTGQITANSFMKRQFGKKLITEFLPSIDLTHVIDTSLAFIPAHGTPTVILLGRQRRPVASTIRAVMGIKREDEEPADPAKGMVWSSILNQVDRPDSKSPFVSVSDAIRENFHKHPWSVGGGGAAELKQQLDEAAVSLLASTVEEIGFGALTRADDAFVMPHQTAIRKRIPQDKIRLYVTGEEVRDWRIVEPESAIWPYDSGSLASVKIDEIVRWLWPNRVELSDRSAYGQTQLERGLAWYEYSMFFRHRFRTALSISFACVASHNHFVFDRGGKLFNRHAPVIKLLATASEDDHLSLLGLLNSSTGCFWMKQTFYDRGGGGIGGGIAAEAWERFYEHDGTKLKQFPLPTGRPLELARAIDVRADMRSGFLPSYVLRQHERADRKQLEAASVAWEGTRRQMVTLQEELDWHCYRLYGLIDEDLCYDSEPFFVAPGERAFEIVLARKIRDDSLHTTWFDRHGSTPITDIPASWPDDYRKLVERRIAVIESNPQIALIEQPEYKRRWNDTPWAEKVTDALHAWLLDRLESYFDFDGRMNGTGKPTAQVEPSLLSTAKLADIAGPDTSFLAVAELYRDRPDFDVTKLVTELVESESVPLLPVLRYKQSGLDKRRAWERTWELQRQEDAIDARATKDGIGVNDGGWTAASDDGKSPLNKAQADVLTKEKIGPIPPPPKYKSADFQKGNYWRLRGGLDVPKERWVIFQHCEGADGLPLIAWAGYDHLQLAKAIAAHYVRVQEQEGGRNDPRLVPLLACLIELLPWLKQWHNEMDDAGYRMGNYFEGFVQDEARQMGRTIDAVRAWQPPKGVRKVTARTPRGPR